MNQFLAHFLILFISIFPGISKAQLSEQSLSELEQKLDSVIYSGLETNQIPGLAYIIVEGNRVLRKKGYGLSTFENGIGFIDPDSSIIRIGSITKTFTATALLQLVDRKKVHLHSDVNNYLSSVKVPASYKAPITAAHLLNHSAGLDELRGRLVFNENQLMPLNEFLDNRLVRIREPGVFTSYSTYGIALAGLLVEDVGGTGLENYMRKNIWEPLGMDMTSFNLPEEHQKYLSPGYELENGTNRIQPWEWYHTFPASSINSTVSDMGKYMMMHLNLGTYNGATVLNPETSKAMQTKQLSVHPKVDGFAYGFYEDLVSGINTVGHGGDMLGYSAFLSLVPEKDLGIFVVHYHEGSRLRYQVLQTILNHISDNSDQELPPELKNSTISRFAGNYRWSTYCHSCTEQYYPDTTELVVNEEENTISGFGRTFYQISPLLLKSTDGIMSMGFMEDEQGNITFMSIGNSSTFERVD